MQVVDGTMSLAGMKEVAKDHRAMNLANMHFVRYVNLLATTYFASLHIQYTYIHMLS